MNVSQKTPQPQLSQGLTPLRVAQVLLLLNTAIWIVLGILGLFYLPSDQVSATIARIIVSLMFVNALLMAWVAWGLGRFNRWLYWLGLVLVAVNLILSVTDQFGLFDLIVLALNAVLIGLLFMLRSRFGIKW